MLFQTRINYNMLATNNFLHRIKYIKDPMCSFCAKEPERIRHLLWECEHTKKLLDDVKNWCSVNNIHIGTEEKLILFGSSSRKVSILDALIWLETKYYIYSCRSSKYGLNLKAVKYRLKLLYFPSYSLQY